MKRAPIASQRTTLILGMAGTGIGAWLLWSAYEGRGKTRPFAARFWPGG